MYEIKDVKQYEKLKKYEKLKLLQTGIVLIIKSANY